MSRQPGLTRPSCRRASSAPIIRNLHSEKRPGGRCAGCFRKLPTRPRRSRIQALVMVGVVVLLGGPIATATPSNSTIAALAPSPLPAPTVEVCSLGSPTPPCSVDPSTSPSPTAPTRTPCPGQGCVSQLPTPTPTPANPSPGGGDSGEADCGITEIGGCVTNAINAFFLGTVTSALNPLLDHPLPRPPPPQLTSRPAQPGGRRTRLRGYRDAPDSFAPSPPTGPSQR